MKSSIEIDFEDFIKGKEISSPFDALHGDGGRFGKKADNPFDILLGSQSPSGSLAKGARSISESPVDSPPTCVNGVWKWRRGSIEGHSVSETMAWSGYRGHAQI